MGRGVTMLAYSPHLLVVHPSVKANTLQELVALSKTSDLNFAVTATGTNAISHGPMNFVTDAPTLPAPNTPSANPW